MLAFVLATPAFNLLRVFHNGHGRCPPIGSCCVIWVSSYGCSSSCHLCNLAFWGGSCSSFAVCIKLFRDLSLVFAISCPNIGCLSSFICLVFSISVVTRLLISGGAMPARRYSLYVGVGLRHPVMILQVSFRATDTFLACFDWLHTGHAYSPVEKHRAIPVVRMVWGRAPHWLPASFLSRLFLACTFILVFEQCSLNVNVLSRVTPRNTG